MKKIVVLLLNRIWFLYLATQSILWKKKMKSAAQTQEKYLLTLLRKNTQTRFGREHLFWMIESISAFQKLVPVRGYDEYSTYIEDIEKGMMGVLTKDAVKHFGVSSGSTKASKLIPYTPALIKEFRKGINPWLWHLFKDNPKVLRGRSYWSITPVGHELKYSTGGIPIGFQDERIYFDAFSRWILSKLLVVPSLVSTITDFDSFRYVTVLFLLKEKRLTWLSIWNPTFIMLCLEPIEKHMPQLIKDIKHGTLSINLEAKVSKELLRYLKPDASRAKELESLYEVWQGKVGTISKGRTTFFEELWPDLTLISTWAHGEAGGSVITLQSYFPHATVQPKGLIATEAFVSFPIGNKLAALSCDSHFFEFLDQQGKLHLLHQLQIGKIYSVIVTTGGGFYRYQLHDLVKVEGYIGDCPLVSFLGREDKVVDMCGEKLNETFVKQIVSDVFSECGCSPTFWMMAPEHIGSLSVSYKLFIQGGVYDHSILHRLAHALEEKLKKNYHYNYCRNLNQLKPCNVFVIDASLKPDEVYLQTCTKLGQRLGDIKFTRLHSYTKWSEEFTL